jgi:hypothetical protein
MGVEAVAFEPGFDQLEETALAVGCGGEDRLGDRLPHVRRVSIRMVMRIANRVLSIGQQMRRRCGVSFHQQRT